jgi:hypothetical protein
MTQIQRVRVYPASVTMTLGRRVVALGLVHMGLTALIEVDPGDVMSMIEITLVPDYVPVGDGFEYAATYIDPAGASVHAFTRAVR